MDELDYCLPFKGNGSLDLEKIGFRWTENTHGKNKQYEQGNDGKALYKKAESPGQVLF